MSQATLEEIGATGQVSWSASCAAAVIAQNITTGLVDQYGHPMSVFNNNTAGITVHACYSVCGPDIMYQRFNYTTFAAAFTSWLLPWLALTAQLPYETSGPKNDILSGLLAVGSPALMTYSLSLTIMNRFWVRSRFAKLKEVGRGLADHAPHLPERICAAADLLQDAQHAPLRVSQEDGWLSSLIFLPDNQHFWETVRKDLGNTRRGFTASLFAQMLMAAIAFLFTIISSFIGDGGDNLIAFQIASGSIWIWMIPVILGWIFVSTQSRAGAINDALQNTHHATYRALEERRNDVFTETKRQRGIMNRSGLNPTMNQAEPIGENQAEDHQSIQMPVRRGSQHSYTPIEESDPLNPPGWLGFSVSGDEREEGPIYNYAHIFTWFQCAMRVEKGFACMLKNLADPTVARPETSKDVADYCGLPLAGGKAYIPWPKLNPRVWHHILYASVVALFVQWGTTGPAILIAYLTPTVGLGCRSGSYLLYGSVATISWMLLVSSSLLSHAAMLRYQAVQSTRMQEDILEPVNFGHSVICGFAVCTRILGKMIAVLNAGWLLAFTLLEYIGALENCWCDANVLSMHSHGWAAVFLDAADISSAASGSWAGGLALSLGVCAISLIFFSLGSGDALVSGE